MRRRNRCSLFFSCLLLHLFGATKLVFFLASIGMFVEISLVNERAVRIAFVFHIPVGFQIPVHDVNYKAIEMCVFLLPLPKVRWIASSRSLFARFISAMLDLGALPW